jgi:hypothetical protein
MPIHVVEPAMQLAAEIIHGALDIRHDVLAVKLREDGKKILRHGWW